MVRPFQEACVQYVTVKGLGPCNQNDEDLEDLKNIGRYKFHRLMKLVNGEIRLPTLVQCSE